MSIIYEVNLKVAQNIANEYLSWLHDHIQEMLQLKGFLAANLYQEAVDSEDCCLVIQYQLDSMSALEHYFVHEAPRLRQHAMDRFGDKFSISRRILKKLDGLEAVS